MEKTIKKYKIFSIVISALLLINIAFTGVVLGLTLNKNNNQTQTELKTKYTLYIGTNDKDTYKLEIPFETCLNTVREICTKYTGGGTCYEVSGFWKDDTGTITKEQTIACILEEITISTVHSICDEIMTSLNQASILIETNQVTSTYYSSKK